MIKYFYIETKNRKGLSMLNAYISKLEYEIKRAATACAEAQIAGTDNSAFANENWGKLKGLCIAWKYATGSERVVIGLAMAAKREALIELGETIV